MDIRFLGSLLQVVEQGSIAAAARAQGLTAAAVSQRIQALEKQLGQALLTRVAHRAQPTEACLNILPRARHLLAEVQALQDDANTDALAGSLRLGAISTALTGLLPQALRGMANNAPQVKLTIRPGTSASLYRELLDNSLDAVILVKPPFALPKHFSSHKLQQQALVLLSQQPLNQTLAKSLQNHAYLRYDPQSWGGRLVQQYLQQQDLDIDAYCDLDALESIALLVAQGLGISIVPAWSQNEFNRLGLSTKVLDKTRFQREIVLLCAYQPKRPKVIECLLDLLR